jgi:hypothetical protein
MPRFAALLALLLAAGRAHAQDEALAAAPLEGVGRISVAGGWRLASNQTFYDSFYALPGYECSGATCPRDSFGGPFGAATFAYAVTENIELGIDLFATGQQLRLNNAPTLNTYTYGALVGLRFQTLWDVLTPQGIVPFVGLELGPSLVLSEAKGIGRQEQVQQPWVGTVGASFRLSPTWAILAEYRLAFARGQSPFNTYEPDPALGLPKTPYKDLASFNAGGNWFALGLSYMFPPDPIRPFASP